MNVINNIIHSIIAKALTLMKHKNAQIIPRGRSQTDQKGSVSDSSWPQFI